MTPEPAQVRLARQFAGLSVQQVAALLGVSRQTVYNWESGVHPMKPRDFEYLLIKVGSKRIV